MISPPHISGSYIRTGIKRLGRNALTTLYRPQSGWSPAPVLVVMRPTERCNLSCKMCFDRGENVVSENWKTEGQNSELSEADCRSLIDELAVFQPTFYITGGEPLLSQKLLPIVTAVKSRRLYVSINTNGTLLKKMAPELVEAQVDKIIISLDGPREVHNAIRGDTFDLIAEGIARVEVEKKRRQSSLPFLRAQCVISPDNLHSLSDSLAEFQKLGLEQIRFQHLSFAFSKDDFHIDDFIKSVAISARISTTVLPRGAIDVSALKAQLSIIHKNQKRRLAAKYEPRIKLADLNKYYYDPDYGFTNFCFSPWRRLVVSPGGEMGPCQGIYLGKYPEESPSQFWWGDEFRAFRRRIMEKGLFSHCIRCCHREYYPPRIGLAIS